MVTFGSDTIVTQITANHTMQETLTITRTPTADDHQDPAVDTAAEAVVLSSAPGKGKKRKADTPNDPKAPKTPRPKQAPKEKATDRAKDTIKPKRGQARPHRRLETEVITLRLEKLKKRIARSSTQLEDAKRHAEGYQREMTHRQEEGTDHPKEQASEQTSEQTSGETSTDVQDIQGPN